MAVDLAYVHFHHSPRQRVADGRREILGNADVFSEMVQCAHRENAKRGVGACHRAGNGVDGPVASAGYNALATLPDGLRSDGAELFATSHNHFDGDAEFVRDTGDERTRLIGVNGSTVEDVDRPSNWFSGSQGIELRLMSV